MCICALKPNMFFTKKTNRDVQITVAEILFEDRKIVQNTTKKQTFIEFVGNRDGWRV